MKGGWSLVENEHPDCEVTFFAAAKDNLKSLEVSDGRLISNNAHCAQRMRRSSNGLNGIDGDYDQYLVVGLEFGFNTAVRLWRTFRIEGEEADERTPVSDACFECTIEDGLRESISVVTVEKLRKITDRPIAVLPYPLRCRHESSTEFRRLRESGRDRKVKELAESAAKRLSQQHEFRLFLQPEHTLSSPLVTNAIYARVQGATDDHMNASYGKEVLNMLLHRSPAGLL
jgi:hypothetical protein